jgi:hypothetical protein
LQPVEREIERQPYKFGCKKALKESSLITKGFEHIEKLYKNHKLVLDKDKYEDEIILTMNESYLNGDIVD